MCVKTLYKREGGSGRGEAGREGAGGGGVGGGGQFQSRAELSSGNIFN